jgi:hypothetical protein
MTTAPSISRVPCDCKPEIDLVSRHTQMPCPVAACAGRVHYAAGKVRCPQCGWAVRRTAQEAHEFFGGLLHFLDTNCALFLREKAARTSAPPEPLPLNLSTHPTKTTHKVRLLPPAEGTLLRGWAGGPADAVVPRDLAEWLGSVYRACDKIACHSYAPWMLATTAEKERLLRGGSGAGSGSG